ncbi:MAG: hypothetical protein JHC95_02310 [Solirubrobacteraceae bacterium]|nr:hypothetical protein [Solirubrobacteraceae bacterium]
MSDFAGLVRKGSWMSDKPRTDDDDALERMLVAARPHPSESFVESTELRLFARRKAARARRLVLPAVGLSGGLAVALLVALLVGSGPLAPNGAEEVRALQDCSTTTVTTTETVGTLLQQPNGQLTVERREAPISRPERRCR